MMVQLILTLVSGEKLNVTHIRLVNADVVDGITARMQELAAVTNKQAGAVLATGDPAFVAGVMATASVVTWLSHKTQVAEAKRLTEELTQLIERARTGGTFVPISKVQGVEVPIPRCWQMEAAKRLRTEQGTVEKIVKLCHSGDSFITVQLADHRELTVFWDKVESTEIRVDE